MKNMHAKSMMQYAEDATKTDKPWLLWEYRGSISKRWQICPEHPRWGIETRYRRTDTSKTADSGSKLGSPFMTTAERNMIKDPPIGTAITNRDTGLEEIFNGDIWDSVKPLQDELMKFDPATGIAKPYPSHAGQWRKFHGENTAFLFNPWSGTVRSAEDVGSDRFGYGIIQRNSTNG